MNNFDIVVTNLPTTGLKRVAAEAIVNPLLAYSLFSSKSLLKPSLF